MCPPPSGPDRAQIQQLNLIIPPIVRQKNQDRIKNVELYTHFLICTPLPYGTLRTDNVEDTMLRTATLRTDNVEDRRHWGQTTLSTGDAEDRRPWEQIHPPIHFPTLGPKEPQKPSNLHIFSNVGSIYPIKYVHSPNRNPQNYIFSPNVGRWQHISNETFIPQMLASYIFFFGLITDREGSETVACARDFTLQ